MRTAGELAGLAVVGEGTGERLGRLQDVLFDPSNGRITGFLVKVGGLLSKPHLLPILFVRRLGQDAVLVEQGRILEEVASDPVYPDSLNAHSLDNRPVLDDTGKFLGKVDDVLVSEDSLTVTALLFSTGFIGNLLHGKPHVPLHLVKAIGQDSIVIPSSYAEQPAATGGSPPPSPPMA